MRIKCIKENIDYSETQLFFDHRVSKYKNNNPYAVTMYQDNHPELVKARNEKEIQKLLPLLRLDENTKVLDVACGIGRWSDAITEEIEGYCGIDFCQGLIDLALKRNKNIINRCFYTGKTTEVEDILKKYNKGRYNRVLLIGALMYLNDDDVSNTLEQIEHICKKQSVICIREPIGLKERLTLKEQYSEELNDAYNAIYRTRDELYEMIENCLIKKGFFLVEEDFLFKEEALNNRKETSQYFFLLERNI